MSFLGGSTNRIPQPAQKPLGQNVALASTNEAARQLPYMAGKTRVGVTWLCDAFNVKTRPVNQQAGKGQTIRTGYNYFADIAGLVCHGLVDGIHKIYLNGDEAWSGTVTRTPGDDFADITVDKYGVIRIYWGTDTQNADTVLLSSGFDHPPYRNQCYIRWQQLFFGFNQTNAQNVELVISRYPTPGWMTAAVNVQDDCNPIAIVAEWLTNPIFGLGWDVSRIDTAGLDAVAEQLEDEGVGLSPWLTRQDTIPSLITQLCQHFDGFRAWTADGKFTM